MPLVTISSAIACCTIISLPNKVNAIDCCASYFFYIKSTSTPVLMQLIGEMAERQMAEQTYGRKSNERNDVWPKGIWPNGLMTKEILSAKKTKGRKANDRKTNADKHKIEQASDRSNF